MYFINLKCTNTQLYCFRFRAAFKNGKAIGDKVSDQIHKMLIPLVVMIQDMKLTITCCAGVLGMALHSASRNPESQELHKTTLQQPSCHHHGKRYIIILQISPPPWTPLCCL